MSFEPWQFLIGAGIGATAAFVFLALLWVSVRRLQDARRPVLWLGLGAAVRIVAVVGLLYVLYDGYWERLVGGLAGFVFVRLALVRWIASTETEAAGARAGDG